MSDRQTRTDDLIRALAQDAAMPAGPGLRAALMLAMVPALLVSFAVMMMTVGMRQDFAKAFMDGAVPFKLAVTLVLTAGALLLARRAARPEDEPRLWRYLVPAGVVVLAGLLFEVVATKDGVDMTGLFDLDFTSKPNTPLACVSLVLLFSLPPLIAAFHVMRRGAARSPALAGAAAGLFAAGIGASVYALHCVNDDAMFVAIWYGIAVAIVAGAGALLGRKLLNW